MGNINKHKNPGGSFHQVYVNKEKNSRSKKSFIIILIVALILVVAATAFLTMKHGNDGSDKDSKVNETITADSPEGVSDAFFDAYTNCDSATTGKLLAGMGDSYSFGDLTSLIASNTEAKIGSAKISDESNATVPVTLTTIDLVNVISKLPEDIASKEEANEALSEALSSNAAEKSFDVDVKLTKNADGEWKIVITNELSNALMGGMFSYISESEVAE